MLSKHWQNDNISSWDELLKYECTVKMTLLDHWLLSLWLHGEITVSFDWDDTYTIQEKI